MSPSQDIYHLGIIAGIVDEISIVEIVDRLLGTHEQENVSCGPVVKALILNGMGFLTAPLYLFSEFFEGKATEHLLGHGVLPEQLNDTRMGRVLDKLYAYGVAQMFITIAIAVVQKFGIAVRCAHLDAISTHDEQCDVFVQIITEGTSSSDQFPVIGFTRTRKANGFVSRTGDSHDDR